MRLLHRFRAQIDAFLQAFTGALRAGDAEDAKRLLHTLKGTAATVGATAAAERVARLETAGLEAWRAAQADGSLTSLLERTRAVVAAILEPEGATARPENGGAGTSHRLDEVRTLLATSDVAATKAVKSLNLYFPDPACKDSLKVIHRLASNYDFPQALEELDRLIASAEGR
jgi:HPt (histidine-containing phosphotransfer) domain-containing protein